MERSFKLLRRVGDEEVIVVGKNWPFEFSWDGGKTFQEGLDKSSRIGL